MLLVSLEQLSVRGVIYFAAHSGVVSAISQNKRGAIDAGEVNLWNLAWLCYLLFVGGGEGVLVSDEDEVDMERKWWYRPGHEPIGSSPAHCSVLDTASCLTLNCYITISCSWYLHHVIITLSVCSFLYAIATMPVHW